MPCLALAARPVLEKLALIGQACIVPRARKASCTQLHQRERELKCPMPGLRAALTPWSIRPILPCRAMPWSAWGDGLEARHLPAEPPVFSPQGLQGERGPGGLPGAKGELVSEPAAKSP